MPPDDRARLLEYVAVAFGSVYARGDASLFSRALRRTVDPTQAYLLALELLDSEDVVLVAAGAGVRATVGVTRAVTEALLREGRFDAVTEDVRVGVTPHWGLRTFAELRDLRQLALGGANEASISRAVEALNHRDLGRHPIMLAFDGGPTPFELERFAPDTRDYVRFWWATEAWEEMIAGPADLQTSDAALAPVLTARQALLRFLDEGPEALADYPRVEGDDRLWVPLATRALAALVGRAKPNRAEAAKLFQKARTRVPGHGPLRGALGLLEALSCVNDTPPDRFSTKLLHPYANEHLERLHAELRGTPRHATSVLGNYGVKRTAWDRLIASLVVHWLDDDPRLRAAHAQLLEEAAPTIPHRWIRGEHLALARALRGERDEGYLTRWVEVAPPWRRALARLSAAILPAEAEASERVERLLWVLTPLGGGHFDLSARVQRRTAKGWTKGRRVELRAIVNDPSKMPFGPEDDAVRASFTTSERGLGASYYLSGVHARRELLDALVGHPRVVREDNTFVPVVRATPRLRVVVRDDSFPVELSPQTSGIYDRGDRYEVVKLDTRQEALARAISEGLKIPLEAQDELEPLLERLAEVAPIDASGPLTLSALEDVKADPAPRVRLRREGEGLRYEIVATPLGEDGPVAEPGRGHAMLIGGGRRTERDLAEEAGRLVALYETAPTLAGRQIASLDVIESLSLLAELRDADAIVEWVEGSPIRLERPESGVRLVAAQRGDWLEPTGGVELDDAVLVAYEALLGALRRGERFVRVDDDRFVAIEGALQRTLARLDAFAQDDGTLHPLVALLDDPLLDLEGEGDFAAERERIREAMAADVPVPRTLEAELRPYQVEGFRWVARLARAGLGACLADDMGLGKTVQTLAVLLDRARSGPALVVAPTSVLANWATEAQRFAPSLRVHLLRAGVAAEVAEGAVDSAEGFDVVVTSYGMLQSRTALFGGRRWATVVLDEAQAIKNATTKTAKIVHGLDADARVALSGTPIENHLAELWSLFRFLIPGLLGGQRAFQQRYLKAMDREESLAEGLAGQRLRERVRPFVLRRTKREVLRELPEKTEIVLRVDPSDAQRAFIEAVRREGLERVGGRGKDARLELLAALTRLRQACCDPRLLAPGTKVPSAKMEAFRELVAELREGGHRALVFSQFVSLLTLAREALDAEGIAYQYLDGSTPPKARAERVAAFQDGEGELFLVSLKAGGTGLNLTAADYVIHLDPWWNPAAEDQASDRAHRIGQTRPVTVYRLVLAESIEERILELHARKRELAESILSDAGDADRRIDLAELERLLAD
ncbi:MAG: DEAD/DEAH box helicase [Myxococcales bacterium]|nr:DEAD/DEAH box helicase [Myxococcales bacterium]